MMYERVRFLDGNRVRAVFLRDIVDRELTVVGTEVDRYGDEVAGSDFDIRKRVISKNLIRSRRRYVVDLKYGWLVPASRQG